MEIHPDGSTQDTGMLGDLRSRILFHLLRWLAHLYIPTNPTGLSESRVYHPAMARAGTNWGPRGWWGPQMRKVWWRVRFGVM